MASETVDVAAVDGAVEAGAGGGGGRAGATTVGALDDAALDGGGFGGDLTLTTTELSVAGAAFSETLMAS